MKKIGILVDSRCATKELHDFLLMSKGSKNYKITTVIVNNFSPSSKNIIHALYQYIKRRGIKRFLNGLVFKIIVLIERIFLKCLGLWDAANDGRYLLDGDFEFIEVEPIVSKSGLLYSYSDRDLSRMQASDLDLVVRCGGGILDGKILDVFPNGVLSFHHGDNRYYRGGPPGFWEVFERCPRTGFVIQRLTHELDGGDVLYRGFVATEWCYLLNRIKVLSVSNPFLHRFLDNLTGSHSAVCPIIENQPYSRRLYTVPSFYNSLLYIFKTSFLVFRKLKYRIFRSSQRWGVAYCLSSEWRDASLRKARRFPARKNKFIADPFLFPFAGGQYCFVEDYDFQTRKGHISVFFVENTGVVDLGAVVEEGFHLSFPFIFEFDGEIYMCPETHEARDIRLYKCEEFPMKWKFHKTLIDDVSAVDTLIFKKHDKWWLLTNFDISDHEDHSSQLHVFWSDDPVNGEWCPHSNNPVIFDPLRARNGGIIFDGDDIYRVFQKQGFNAYGRSCGISKITKISQNLYKEEIVANLEPDFFDNASGIHTFNFNSGIVVFDYFTASLRSELFFSTNK